VAKRRHPNPCHPSTDARNHVIRFFSLFLNLSASERLAFIDCLPNNKATKAFSRVNQKDLHMLNIKTANVISMGAPTLAVPQNPIPGYTPSTHYKETIRRLNEFTQSNNEAGRRDYISAALYDIIDYLRRHHSSTLIAIPEYALQYRSAEHGITLSGNADWIIGAQDENNEETSILLAVEAKHGDLTNGIYQVTAQMLAIRQEREMAQKRCDVQFGIVSNGRKWVIVKLANSRIHLSDEYSIERSGQDLRDWLCFLLYHIMHSTPRGSKETLSQEVQNRSWQSPLELTDTQ
jgi:hypothetical protein